MGFGGPVWHASVGRLAGEEAREAMARRILNGVGDVSLGEWVERGRPILHIRRRLSDAEAPVVGPVVDIRGTDEAEARMRVMRLYLPPAVSWRTPF